MVVKISFDGRSTGFYSLNAEFFSNLPNVGEYSTRGGGNCIDHLVSFFGGAEGKNKLHLVN